MGGILSCKARQSELYEGPCGESCKRQRTSSSYYEESPQIFPSLPDEISIQILARLPRICYLGAKSVSSSWKSAIMSPELYKVRKELGTTEEWLYVLTKVGDDELMWYALDPVSGKWQRLPAMPNVGGEESKWALSGLRTWNMVGSSVRIADTIRGWLGKKDASGRMPYCGCAVGSVDGSIYVIGGFCKASAMSCVFRYDPILNSWSETNPMSVGRAYCKASVLNKKLYVVGGVTKGHGGLAHLHSAEVFDPCTGLWAQIPSMPFSKAQDLPTAFLADLLKPMATGMTSYKGKLYVPQSLCCWPFYVDVGGEVYDPETNSWVEMPSGMGEGWPARQAGTKLSVIVDGDLYALDPSSSMESAKIKVYDHEDDVWKVVNGDVPIRDFTDAESPYLLAGFRGKLHVITKDANGNIAVMHAERENHLSSSPSTSSATLKGSSSLAVETNVWKVIATKKNGSEELVNCQILDI